MLMGLSSDHLCVRPQVQAKTSSPDSSPPLPPRALAQDGLRPSRLSRSPPTSPALSTASTADGEASSPFVPNLPTPRLPERAAEFLKTPPSSSGDTEDGQYVTASWGSPYPKSEEANFLRRSPSSEPSEGSTIHRLELDTPFLRPAPSLVYPPNEYQPSSLAAILVNRARRPGPARGLTEDWIRQHTAGSENVEPRHWLSDGTDSEHSSLSGSFSGDEGAWLEERGSRTPRASNQSQPTPSHSRQTSRHHPRARSSTETLKQSSVDQLPKSDNANMATAVPGFVLPDTASTVSMSTSTHPNRPTTPAGPTNSANARKTEEYPPVTPTRQGVKKEQAPTPRAKKKVPWRGKNIMVLLPRDEGRGQPGKGPIPLRQHEVTNMFREWEELGYDIRGFDLNVPSGYTALPVEHHSRSRDEWPDVEEVIRERKEHKFKVTLPDLDAWRNYMNELTEAKLRALGVSLGGDDPPPPQSISPNPAGLSRRATITQYPPLPFSPTIPTSSPSSAQGMQQYPFPSQTSAGGIHNAASPASFHGHYNQRQSVSIPTSHSPFGFHPPQPQPSPRDMMFQQQGMHRVSPSLSMSPYSPGGFQPPLPHQRHQSLQFPQLPHQQQFKHPARASPRLQELRETDEEEETKSSSKTPEPAPYIRHNASDSLQKEIDEAEYHLEEQFRSQLEYDQDYSPHNEDEKRHAAGQPETEPSKVFAPQAPRFEGAIDENLVLHHPRPHSRGHSLSQKYFGEEDMPGKSATKNFSKLKPIQDDDKPDEDVATNPGNAGTPIVQKFAHLAHDRTFSTISNPWQNEQPLSRRPSHESKPSFSKLNVAAPEFKFNPTSTFQPGQFNFGSNTFQPAVFQGGAAPNAPESVHSSAQLSPPAGPSTKINVNAPVFSPGSSDFSFSAVGAPTFRPDAPSFTPLQSISGSVTSPIMSGSESGKMASSIFGNIDLGKPEIVKPVKASKAIPIIRPETSSTNTEEQPPAPSEDEHGRTIDETRVKRLRGANDDDDDDDDHQFAGSSELAQAESKGTEEEHPSRESGISSTIVSDSTEARDTTSLSDVSAEHNANGWAPVEIRSDAEDSANNARELEEDIFNPHHEKSLSASARPFIPDTSVATDDDDKESTPVPSHIDEALKESAMGTEVGPAEEELVAEEVPRESIEIEPSSVTSHAGDEDQGLRGSIPSPSPSPLNGGLAASRFAASRSPEGLAASKYANSPSPVSEAEVAQSPFAPDADVQGDFIFPITAEESEQESEQESESSQETIPVQHGEVGDIREPTFEEIDAVMQHINENDPALGVKKTVELPIWHQPSPTRQLSLADTTDETPKYSLEKFPRGVAPSPSPRHYHLPLGVRPPLHTAELEDPFRGPEDPFLGPEDPFMDPPVSVQLSRPDTGESQVASDDWERAFSDDEQDKLDSRANFFDGRVNDLVDGVLEARLGPLETSLQGIQRALNMLSERTPPNSHRERRSMSAEYQESDADDEDDEPVPRRSMSPRRDKRLDQIRAVVLDALAFQQRNTQDNASAESMTSILKSMEDIKQQFSESLQSEFRPENLRSVIESVVESRLPPPPQPVVVEGQEELAEKYNELSARYAELEQHSHFQEAKNNAEVESRRMVEDRAAEFERHLHMAETKIEVEIMNRNAHDQRVVDLLDRLRHQEETNDAEVTLRRAAEDRLSEIQRLLRTSSEEEIRLRDAVEEKDEKIMILETTHNKNAMRLAMLDAALGNSQKEKGELEQRVQDAEAEARDSRQEAKRWRIEAERTLEMSDRQDDDLHNALEDNKQLHKLIDTLGTTLNENERIRDSWRSKFMSLQQDMETAMRHVTEENARRAKREQTMLARQEVLDAKLFAESRTRERLETELERLEAGERQGMKAVNEAKRLDVLLAEMRTENHNLQQSAARYQAEFQEARESGAREVQRTRESMQAQIEDANYQVNVVREELEDQISRLRGQLDQAKLDSDTVRSQYDMLMEEALNNRKGDIKEVVRKHQDEVEDMQARFERQINNTVEDSQRAETNLLERLSISTSKCEHLQDRVQHLEEKLDIAREAARAAAQAAKASGYTPPPVAAIAPAPISYQPAQRTITLQSQPQLEAVATALQLPGKISPQALRETIMVLQEQLQEREQKIEELEQIADPEAQTKIAKRDDEITWLRELLAVRHSDLQDIITALGRDDYDQDRVRDAAIRLKANLQMEQQERERAANGGSSINLPNIAASLRDASPRVAQAVGPLAAAWGNWRKGANISNLSNVSQPPPSAGSNNATPRKDSPASQSSFLSGLLTPPATGVRQTPPSQGQGQIQGQAQQPTAFSSTGRRFTAQDLANRPKPAAVAQRQAQKMPVREGSPAPRQLAGFPSGPQTPPMMRPATYDDDAMAAEDFDDAGFFLDDE